MEEEKREIKELPNKQLIIGYIFYEAPREEKNFATLLDMIDAWMPMEKWDAQAG